MLIRKADEQDLDAVCRLAAQINRQHHLAMPELFRGDVDAEAELAFWRDRMEGEDRVMLLAEREGQILAFATLTLQMPPPMPFLQARRICRLGTIVVDEAHQRQGLGSRLISAAEDWGRQQHADELRLEVMDFNQGAHALYLRQGLTPQSQIMSKPLTGDAQ
ncbi:GNAT family N-acetyltransferase [Chromobacterium sp. IIBBL 290-4]|uniref:GNAT family N-acetyltransferase n=1 Tax=Chromobacterium sp. IIBBL 290-4 TaxID=2953890 RepID=UPI0020B76A38|nr:GNAT family N-acetyltransferase [Chromobacterium sp. IIBBL 290-4]UTH72474.1 GNAT family N-acetyltransferase [Chromobacterium sp. IIBBL 290-4]